MPWIDPEWLDYKMEMQERQRREYEQKYPTRWRKFLHWLGII